MFKPFNWIARQGPNIRVLGNEVVSDGKFPNPELPELESSSVEERQNWFAKGKLWPTLFLVEQHISETGGKKEEIVYARLYRRTDGAIIDILMGETLDFATLIAVDFNLPLYSVNCSRKGSRGNVQRIHLELNI